LILLRKGLAGGGIIFHGNRAIDAWLLGNRQQLRCSYGSYHALALVRRAIRKRREMQENSINAIKKTELKFFDFRREWRKDLYRAGSLWKKKDRSILIRTVRYG
jgi:hypothetical protein